jgi:hypothetical protein
MKTYIKNLFYVIVTLFFACNNTEQTNKVNTQDSLKTQDSMQTGTVEKAETVELDNVDENLNQALLIADTITYDVVVKNPDENDTWTAECLKNLKLKVLADKVFDAVYSGQATAYDYFDEKKLSIEDVKEMEQREGLSRDNIGRMQFVESWYFDEKKFRLIKKVNAIMFGYQSFDFDNKVKGYKAGIKVYLNTPQEQKSLTAEK